MKKNIILGIVIIGLISTTKLNSGRNKYANMTINTIDSFEESGFIPLGFLYHYNGIGTKVSPLMVHSLF